MPKRRRATTRCRDCIIVTTPNRCKDWQWYMVHDAVWEAAGMERFGGELCIDCLEKRLGRPLTGADFPDIPVNRIWGPDTPRLAALKREATDA